MPNGSIVVSNKLKSVVSITVDNIKVSRNKGLFLLRIDGNDIVETHNIFAVLRPLTDRNLAKSIFKAFDISSPTPADLWEILPGFDITYI